VANAKPVREHKQKEGASHKKNQHYQNSTGKAHRGLLAIATLTALCGESTGGISKIILPAGEFSLSSSIKGETSQRFAFGYPSKSNVSTIPSHITLPLKTSKTGVDAT
jgi:hypothetical protein